MGPSSAALVRQVRLATGLVLFAYVTTHLLNHACGLFGVAAMEAGRKLFISTWRSPLGSAALYLSLGVHLALALWSLYQRRQLRLPLWEAAQLIFGLAIPTILITHAIGTHLASYLYGVIDSYTRMLLVYWMRPEMGIRQVLLLLIAWTHGCIGLHFWLRIKPWYPRAAPIFGALALLVPLLALLGFLEAMREINELAANASWVKTTLGIINELRPAQRQRLAQFNDAALLAFGAIVAATLVARAVRNVHERRYRSVRITYPNRRQVVAPMGYTVLEASRFGSIPHASVCGGRGRCSTCRVRITAGLRALPPARAEERAVLQRVGAAPDVRLACQLRPTRDVCVTPLLPPGVTPSEVLALPGDFAGEEREICVLFADLRGFTQFAEFKLPYDTVFFLNRYFEIMSSAIEGAGGIANQFTGDGIMALFGVQSGPAQGCRDALVAASRMIHRLGQLSAELSEDLVTPMRMGIGIHAGPAVVGRMGRGTAKYLTAVGDTVNVASRLQDLTKKYQCTLVLSESTAHRAELDVSGFPRHEVMVRKRIDPLAIRVIASVDELVGITSSAEQSVPKPAGVNIPVAE